MNSSQPGGPPPDPDRLAARRRLADLVGRLLARRWLRDRRRPDSGGGPPFPTIRPAIEPLARSADGG